MSVLRTKSILLHIREDLLDIERFTRGITIDDFLADSMRRKAVCMSLLNIGEAVRGLPEDMFARNPNIPWASIIGLRNRAAHGYHSLDGGIVWNIASNEIKNLLSVVLRELDRLGNDAD